MIDIVIDLCGGLSYMTFAVAAARRPGGLGAVRRNRLPPPLALGGGGGHQAAKQMEEEGKRKEGRKEGRRGSDIVGRALSSLCSTGCGEWGWDGTGLN